MLAGSDRADYWSIKDLFESTLFELGMQLPDEQGALSQLARHVAQQIDDGEVPPAAGASWIWKSVYHRIEREGDLRIFVGLASEWEDHPDDRPTIDARIVAAANEFFNRGELRRWVRLQARCGVSPLAEPRALTPMPVDELPITGGLGETLSRWAALFDERFPDTVGAQSCFVSVDEAERFVDQGRSLAAELQAELGDTWVVEYYPEPTRPPGVRLKRRCAPARRNSR